MSDLVLHTRVVTGSGGGPEKTILNSPRFLRDDGYPMICAYMRDPRDELFAELESRAEAAGAHLVAIDDHGPLDWRILERFRALCAEHPPAIWHGHDYKSNLIGLLLSREFDMKLVTTVHGWVKRTWKTPLYYWIDRRCLKRYEAVVCVSEDTYEQSLRFGVDESRCVHIPNGIATDEYARTASTAEAKRALGLAEDEILVGAVGRLSPEKAFEHLIAATNALIEEGLRVRLWIVGEGDEEESLRALVRSLGREQEIELLGFRRDLVPLYQAMDVFALSSIREGLPNVLLEAMALEVPVVSTRVAGIPRLVIDGQSGLLVEPGAPEPLVEGLRAVIRDADLRARLGAGARALIEKDYSFTLRMSRMRAVYDRLLGRAG